MASLNVIAPLLRPRVCLLLVLALALTATSCSDDSREVTLYAVGDVMLGRYIAKVMAVQGSNYPFKEICSTLQRGDVVFGNLEAIISSEDLLPLYPQKPYNFHASKNAVQALKQAGFQVLSLANNHAMDYGTAPLRQTKKLLSGADIATMGAGDDIHEARQPAIVTKKGLRFGFLGYGIAHDRSVYAGRNRSGIAPVKIEDILADVQNLRNRVDVLAVSIHWGIEYENTPTLEQRKDAHRIIDSGADIIIGHHPHVMQGVEVYKGKVIAYSLGNFVFDQKGNGTDRSFILGLRYRDKKLFSIEIVPIDRFKTYFPRVATESVKKEMLEKIGRLSQPVNAKTPKLFSAGFVSVTEEESK